MVLLFIYREVFQTLLHWTLATHAAFAHLKLYPTDVSASIEVESVERVQWSQVRHRGHYLINHQRYLQLCYPDFA